MNQNSPSNAYSVRSHPTLLSHPRLYLSSLFTKYTPAEKAGLERTAWFFREGHAYSQEHSTQPQTIGYSLADSPVGLLAWIYEKLVNWTDEYPWEDDEGTGQIRRSSIRRMFTNSTSSFDLDIYLLVLDCWACGVSEDLLRIPSRERIGSSQTFYNSSWCFILP